MVDLVCWDFGDTLVDERFMRIPPDGVPEWSTVYESVLAERAEWLNGWDLGRGSLNDLVAPLADRLPMSHAHVVRHLRMVWGQITWFPDSRAWVNQLAGKVPQAVVTVNPHEFSGIARACGLDVRIPTIVTSAELGTLSKVAMAEHARQVLGLGSGLSTTVLVDNKQHNVNEFAAAGGRTILYEQQSRCLDALAAIVPN
jgi:FMN phosphatase YigB (HAD superfamily)